VDVGDLDLEQRLDDTTAYIVVRGEIDVATAPQLREVLHELVQGGSKHIVLDCRALEFLDSSGIGLLVAVRKRLGEDGELVIESPPAQVRKVLELTGVAAELSLRP
jgi:anti-sigma B factor antagonist